MRHILLIITVALTPALALAEGLPQQHHYRNGAASSNKMNLLDGVALNASASSRTVNRSLCPGQPGKDSECYTKVRLNIFFTHDSATDVEVAFSCSMDGGSNYATLTTKACSSGNCQVFLRTDDNDTSGSGNDEDSSAGDEDFSLEYDVRGCTDWKAVVSGTSGGASDLVNLQATAYGG